jgi:signal transduction histidine kinase
LLSNAIKYSSVGSEVCLGIYRDAAEIIFQIQDRGIGIPEADQAHLFEPFHRAQNAVKMQGTGLGLSVAKANVELHGGVITFDSQEGVGTTFTVRLPVNCQNQPDDNYALRLFHDKEDPHH